MGFVIEKGGNQMDQLFYNGKIYTMSGEVVSALWISDGIMIEAGDSDTLLNKVGANTTFYDMQKKCVIPGLIDSHCHMIHTGIQQESLDLSKAKTLEELVSYGRKYIKENNIPEGRWVVGWGFNQNLFPEPILPDIELVNAISDKHPILLERVCGHVGTVNAEGIKVLGIHKDVYIPGGKIGHDEAGELNGIFYEAALDYIQAEISKPNKKRYKEILQRVQKHANSLGLTSVHSNDVGTAAFDLLQQAVKELVEEDKMTIRIFEEISTPNQKKLRELLQKGLHTGDGNLFYKAGNVKIFTDGSLGAHSAYMKDEYEDMPGNRGIAVYKNKELEDLIKLADENYLQVACHAIGDAAVEQCVSGVEFAQKKNGKKDLRHRIVHCQIAEDRLLERMKKADIASDIQPSFVCTDWKMAEKAFGERVKYSYRWKTMYDRGIHMGGGSDSPVESMSPIWGIHCAVNRCDERTMPQEGWHPEEKLSIEEAVALYTRDAAYLAMEEGIKGTLESGKLGDFVVLSDDIFQVPSHKIKEIQVLGTVIGGKICYQKEKNVFFEKVMEICNID